MAEALDQCVTRLQKLIAHINLTNCKTIVEGRSITEIIAEKDSAALRLSTYLFFFDKYINFTFYLVNYVIM
ncbi:hypothetical protein [Veillonella sp.]|uniref:DIP1984 family protein n=1 Tax=Veillonella sp. TaxID=1926307 RepID=UPI003457B5EE